MNPEYDVLHATLLKLININSITDVSWFIHVGPW